MRRLDLLLQICKRWFRRSGASRKSRRRQGRYFAPANGGQFCQRCAGSTLSIVPSSPNFSSIGARVGGGGSCKRDGAPASNAFLKLRAVCSRRMSWRALYSAIDNFSTSGDPFCSDAPLQVFALPTRVRRKSKCKEEPQPFTNQSQK